MYLFFNLSCNLMKYNAKILPTLSSTTKFCNQLFVSTYMLQLPDKATLERFLLDELEK